MSNAVRRIERRSNRSIFHAFLSMAHRMGGDTSILTDGDGKVFTYKELTRAAFALGGVMGRKTGKDETVGILLPTGAGAVIALMALLSRGRIPAMLNFTAGVKNLRSAFKTAGITKVVTAHKFVEIGGLEKLIDQLGQDVEFLFLEDLKEEVGPTDKALAVLGPFLPKLLAAHPAPEEPGVILFTSGTEGTPKGVVLSHKNILANVEQISAHVEILPTDVFFNPLPTFHCYGLTAGTLWPLLSGHPSVLHPSPLQTKIIPQRIRETRSSILFATDTFLSQYMRASAEGGLSSLRIAVCGAERVRDETRQVAERRFGFEVLEGYGVTEAAPVIAANQPGDIQGGTVGKLLPCIETRIESVEGLESGGRLFVRGPNIMKGYLSADRPGEIITPEDGWYDTSDVVSIDEDGYMSIRGRLKRFAKIGGEMVSLAVVENCASAVWPDNMHVATILPDDRKGEQVVLVTDKVGAKRSLLLSWAQSHGVPELAVPRKIIETEEIPLLGTGKVNHLAVKQIADEAILGPMEPESDKTRDEPSSVKADASE